MIEYLGMHYGGAWGKKDMLVAYIRVIKCMYEVLRTRVRTLGEYR